ncbi:MAG: glucokinase [Candidatus Sulfotelmatobacter sp.]|nr:glucokinase [Candidatus Sulfotelmatobacter sp.]
MNSQAVERLVIGVDIGGTKVAAGLVTSSGEIQRQVRTPMISSDTAEVGLAAVRRAIDELLEGQSTHAAKIGGIGICAPGPLDPATGTVINPPNLPCWRNFPLSSEIEKIYGVKAAIDNDANAAALAEYKWGAGRGYRQIFYATVGTGIGTGIVFDGRIYHGRTGAAGEGGHNTIDFNGPRCGCGKPGCIEAFASGPAIAGRARVKLAAHSAQGAALLNLADGNIAAVTTAMVGQACATGDPIAKETMNETVEYLSIWLGNMIDLLDPDVIIIGGGVSGMLTPFFANIQKRLPRWCVNSRSLEIPLVNARYGADAGIAGGAALCAAE